MDGKVKKLKIKKQTFLERTSAIHWSKINIYKKNIINNYTIN